MSGSPATTGVQQQVDRAANGSSDAFLQRLADTLGAKASAGVAYGPAVERDGVTVIPVAKVRWGFGGGGGSGHAVTRIGADGTGGAGGTLVSPIGYITIRRGEAEFHRIKEPVPAWMLPPALLAGTLSAFGTLALYIVVRGLTTLLHRGGRR
ncbi:MAG: spore germination protein GerW family protein [Dehalococcoidia bacterium]